MMLLVVERCNGMCNQCGVGSSQLGGLISYFPSGLSLPGSGTVGRASTKHLYNICTTSAQRLRRWSNIVQMSYKCFALAGRAGGRALSIHDVRLMC